MIQTGKPSQIPKKLLIISIGIVLALFVYGIFFLYPAYQTLGQIQKEVENETASLDRLRILSPVQARAKGLKKIRFSGNLPLPERTALPRTALTALPEKFTAMALEHGLTLFGTDFDINNMNDASKSISLTLGLNGQLKDFRRFLITMIAQPYFDSISFLQIISGKGENKDITLTLGIRIEEERS